VNIAQVFVQTSGSSSKSNEYTLFGFWVNDTELAAYTIKNIELSGEPTNSLVLYFYLRWGRDVGLSV